MDARFMVAVTEAQHAATEEDGLISKIIAAMKVTCNHWLLIDEDLRFKAAVGGAILACKDEEEKELLTKEMKALNSLSALLSGIPVDFSQIEIPKNSIGLMKFWIDIKEGKK